MPCPHARFSPIAPSAPLAVAMVAVLLTLTSAVPGCTRTPHSAPRGDQSLGHAAHTVALTALGRESPTSESISRGDVAQNEDAVESAEFQPAEFQPAEFQPADIQPADIQPADIQPPGEDPRTFLALWYGGNTQVAADQTIESPSAGFPGPIGVRLPEVETDPTEGGETEAQWKSVSDVLLRRGSASVDDAGAITLESGVAFLISATTEVKSGAAPAALLYPIIVRSNPFIETGTVGTDWLCYAYERPTTGGGTEDVLLVCLIKSGDPAQGVWLRWNNQPTATMETNMTFVEFVDGDRSFWPPQAVNLGCDSTDQSLACLIGRVLKDTIQSAKAIGMIPESYTLPATP